MVSRRGFLGLAGAAVLRASDDWAVAPDLAQMVARYSADRQSVERAFPVEGTAPRAEALRAFWNEWEERRRRLAFAALDQHGRVDHILLGNAITRDRAALALAEARREQLRPLVPFAARLRELAAARQRVEPLDAQRAAATLTAIEAEITALRKAEPPAGVSKAVANRAAGSIEELKALLEEWANFYRGYDPLFNWWVEEPYTKLAAALGPYAAHLREKIAGIKPDDKDTIVGDPIGRERLLEAIALEFLPYTPEELLSIAEREFAWCDAEMRRASAELGFGAEWRRALEHVKTRYVAPGEQPALVKALTLEAIEYVEKNNLLTLPPLAKSSWRMSMMSPEQQRINPFFLGGERIIVSYPTAAMTYEQKMMSMRGNNRHFARATVFHEVIPGHHLQMFMMERYRPYRDAFATPFWIEGWALYWEMLLWDRGFTRTPEDRVGALFWRMHRCARIVFSLRFHLGLMSAAECVNYLVERVGHERENAAGEVRRSLESSYPPMYQAAYMLGALQFRALRAELAQRSDRDFHDAVLRLHAIPIELLRAELTGRPLTPEFRSSWRFYQGV